MDALERFRGFIDGNPVLRYVRPELMIANASGQDQFAEVVPIQLLSDLRRLAGEAFELQASFHHRRKEARAGRPAWRILPGR